MKKNTAASLLFFSVLTASAQVAHAQANGEPSPAPGMPTNEATPAPIVTAIASPARDLHLTYPASSGLKQPVDVQFILVDGILKAHFEVRGKEINAKEHLAKGEYPYQFDVVEVFVSVAGAMSPFPYFEFEVSPYGETFQVKIPGGGKPFQDGVELGSTAHAERVKGNWSADLEIPLARLGYDGDPTKIVGNAFAVLGRKPTRSYWTLSIPPQSKPNFHKPEFFRPLLPSASASASGSASAARN